MSALPAPPVHVILMIVMPVVLVFSLAVLIIAKRVEISLKNSRSPVAAAAASAVSKRQSVSGGYNTGGYTSYFVTFEFDSGERAELSVSGEEFGMIAEGDRGTLTYQGTKFISFERIK